MIHSFDLFDTLIGRRCGTAKNLFRIMAEILNDSTFVERRIFAERSLQDQHIEYTLEDIYKAYNQLFDTHHGSYLTQMEWGLELENVFPIKRNVQALKPGDIIVSDMYLEEERLRFLIKTAGIEFNGEIFVSCYGKHTGEVWKGLRGRVISHCGDNQYSDIHKPQMYNIRTRDARTGMNRFEKLYLEHNEDIAWWVRRHRLENIVDESRADRLNWLQITYNAPLLLAACNLLRDYAQYFQFGKLLFMSRDTQLMFKMWNRLSIEERTEYIYISRECLRNGSSEWFEYFNSRIADGAVLVDLASSLGSLKIALPRLEVTPRIWTLIFLPGFKVNYEPIKLHYVTTNIETRINNSWLEMLNYATHWHVNDVTSIPELKQAGVYHATTNQENEYDMRLVQEYHQIFDKMLRDVPAGEISNAKAMVRKILPLINAEGNFLKQKFPGHLQFERIRKRTFQEEQ